VKKSTRKKESDKKKSKVEDNIDSDSDSESESDSETEKEFIERVGIDHLYKKAKGPAWGRVRDV
jgi:hypothetical protein